MLRIIAVILLVLATRSSAVLAHPPPVLSLAQEKATTEEIDAFRKALADAIKAKDESKLRAMYAPSFIHVHPSTRKDDFEARIAAALAGEGMIEVDAARDVIVRISNDWTAIATGLTPIAIDGKSYGVRWMSVYVRTATSWALAATQATLGPELKN